MRLEPQIGQLGVLRVVIMRFSFPAGVGQVVDLHAQAHPVRYGLDDLGQFEDGKLLGELVENAEFAALGGIKADQFDTPHRVADIEEAAGLAAFAIYRQGAANGRLGAETVQYGTENLVVVEAVDQGLVDLDLVGDRTVDNALIEIGGAQAPNLAGEHDVVTVMDLGEVIEGARLLGKRERVLTAVVLDGEETLLDIDVWGAVLSHGSHFHDVAIRGQFADRKQQIEGTDDIRDLGKDGVLVVDHRIGRGALLGEMHDGFGLECGDEGGE